MNSVICEIFKYNVFRTKLNFDLNLLEKFSFELQKNSKGRINTNLGGWQSEDLYDEYSIITELKKIIEKNINIFSKEFELIKNLKIDNLWININEYKDSNIAHIHPSSIFSGVFYVKVPEESGKLTFINPSENIINYAFENNVTSWSSKNSITWSFEPKENELYIFPSFYKHSVTPNMNKKEKRISISFNSQLE
jgi:uncharacterized protein (TIGR02466 family)